MSEALLSDKWSMLLELSERVAESSEPSVLRGYGDVAAAYPRHSAFLAAMATTPILPGMIKISDRDSNVIAQSLYAREEGARILIDLERVMSYLAEGATIILARVELFFPGLGSRASELLASPYSQFSIYGFISSPSVQLDTAHHDLLDSLIVQIEGEKEWRAWSQSKGTRPGDPSVAYDIEQLGAPDLWVKMDAGSIILLPKNTPHTVRTGATVSFHLVVAFS